MAWISMISGFNYLPIAIMDFRFWVIFYVMLLHFEEDAISMWFSVFWSCCPVNNVRYLDLLRCATYHIFDNVYSLKIGPHIVLIWPLWLWSEGNHAINYLASRSADLEHFVISSLIQLVCRLTKIGWFDDDKFKELISDSMNFLNQVSFLVLFAQCLSWNCFQSN